MKRHNITAFVGAIAAAAASAHASFVGATLSVDAHFVFDGVSYPVALAPVTGPASAGEAVRLSGFGDPGPTFDIAFTSDTFTISNFRTSFEFDADDFNGIEITDNGGAFNALTLVETNFKYPQPDAAPADFEMSHRLYVDTEHLKVDFGGLAFDPSTFATFRVGFADSPDTPTSVPAPTAAPAGVALLVLMLCRRRRVIA